MIGNRVIDYPITRLPITRCGSSSSACGRLATSSSRRRPSTRCAQRFPDAHLTYLVEPAAAPVVVDNPHLDEVIVAPRARGLARAARRPRARPAAARRALRPRDRFSRRAARLAAHLAERRARCGSATRSPAEAGCTRAASRGRASCGRGTRSRTSGTCSRRSASRRRIASRFPVEMPADAAVAAAVAGAPDATPASPTTIALVVIHVSAGNPFRRWPAAHFVELVAALAAGDPRRRVIVTSGPSERDAAGRVIADARARSRRRTRAARAVLRRVLARRAARAARSRGALHRRRQRTAAHRRDDRRADRRAVRTDAAGPIGAVARRRLRSPSRWTPARCRAGRAISASASRATSAA